MKSKIISSVRLSGSGHEHQKNSSKLVSKNLTIYLGLVLCLFFNTINAQETFQSRARIIARDIENITKEEKSALKLEIESINMQLEKGELTKEQADEKKIILAEKTAKNIETRVGVAQEDWRKLVQDKVDGKLKEQDSTQKHSYSVSLWGMKVKDGSKIKTPGEKRTTSQFVFATGLNNLVTNNQVAHSDFRYWGSHFYEWGLTCNSRIMKNSNLLHFKYGLSLMYNNLRPTDNRTFVVNGDQTNLEVSPVQLEDSRFRNVYLVAPIHLEFDFSKKKKINDKSVFQSHKAFRMGFGGYAGINVKSKQILNYEDADGNDVRNKTRGEFNTSDYIYGVSTYIGYKETSLYLKYDLNPLFKYNTIDQNNISLGIRFDFN